MGFGVWGVGFLLPVVYSFAAINLSAATFLPSTTRVHDKVAASFGQRLSTATPQPLRRGADQRRFPRDPEIHLLLPVHSAGKTPGPGPYDDTFP